METTQIHTEYITLGQFLKFVNIAATGGDIKVILATEAVEVNGVLEIRRGRKLYPGDVVEVKDAGSFQIAHAND